MPKPLAARRHMDWLELQQRLQQQAADRRLAMSMGIVPQAAGPLEHPSTPVPSTFDKNFAGKASFQAEQAGLNRDLRRELQDDAQAHSKEMFAAKLKAMRSRRGRGRGKGKYARAADKWYQDYQKVGLTAAADENLMKSLASRARRFPAPLRQEMLRLVNSRRSTSKLEYEKGKPQREATPRSTLPQQVQAAKGLLGSSGLAITPAQKQAEKFLLGVASQQPAASPQASSKPTVVRTGSRNGERVLQLSDGRVLTEAQAKAEGLI